MTPFHGVQVALLVGLFVLAAERTWSLCARGPLDVASFVTALAGSTAGEARLLLAQARGTFVGGALASILAAEPTERDVACEVALLEARHAIARRLPWLRVGATLSSFLGMVGSALELAWIYGGDHGLLGLDPTRVQAIGFANAATSVALGVGGSSFALGTWMTLGRHARRLIDDCERAVERFRAAAAGSDFPWTLSPAR